MPELSPANELVLTSSVRGCAELGVVAPLVGAQKSSAPAEVRVSQGEMIAAGDSCSAFPHWQPEESTGRVRFQPEIETVALGVAAGVVAAAGNIEPSTSTPRAPMRAVAVAPTTSRRRPRGRAGMWVGVIESSCSYM